MGNKGLSGSHLVCWPPASGSSGLKGLRSLDNQEDAYGSSQRGYGAQEGQTKHPHCKSEGKKLWARQTGLRPGLHCLSVWAQVRQGTLWATGSWLLGNTEITTACCKDRKVRTSNCICEVSSTAPEAGKTTVGEKREKGLFPLIFYPPPSVSLLLTPTHPHNATMTAKCDLPSVTTYCECAGGKGPSHLSQGLFRPEVQSSHLFLPATASGPKLLKLFSYKAVFPNFLLY